MSDPRWLSTTANRGTAGTAGDYEGLCTNPINRVSIHPPRADSDFHRIIPKECGYHPVEINRCIIFPWYMAREGHQTEHLTYKSYLLKILLFLIFLLHVLKHTSEAYLVAYPTFSLNIAKLSEVLGNMGWRNQPRPGPDCLLILVCSRQWWSVFHGGAAGLSLTSFSNYQQGGRTNTKRRVVAT